MDVRLDLRRSLAENAQAFYEKAKKAKEKIPGIERSIEETRGSIDALAREVRAGEMPVGKKKPEKKRWFERFRWFTSSDGFLVVGGRDATSNEVLIKKYTESSDTVFHADVQGAPFFVVKNPDKRSLPEATIREACQAAASYSSGWKAGVGSVDVYYVAPSQVSKTPESGEYLPKGAFVIRGRREWARNVELRVSVGVERDGGSVVGGPPSSVEGRCDAFILVHPGDRRQGEVASLVTRILEGKFGGRRLLQSDVQKFIPGGGSRVIK